MTIEKSPQLQSVCKHCEVGIGHLYFFDNFLVAEFNEGVNIDFEAFSETKKLIQSFYGSKPFGFIANRINSYSIVLTEASKFNNAFTNVAAYAVVTYNTLTEKIFEIENHFFDYNRKSFKHLEEALSWVNIEVNTNGLRLH